VVVRAFARHGAQSLVELVDESEFRRLRIFEPGTLGPFRRYLRDLDGYVQSSYAPTDRRARWRGVRSEDLMDLSFDSETFDLVITSDIFEHVRRPDVGFAEVFRVLKPGGVHVFTIPGRWPLPPHTVARVDVSGDDDVLLLPAVHHNREHLVYNDFGLDLLELLDDVGFVTEAIQYASGSPTTLAQCSFSSRRPLDARPSPGVGRGDGRHPVPLVQRTWRAQRRAIRAVIHAAR
jgi:SAM-dependent methyltransferase